MMGTLAIVRLPVEITIIRFISPKYKNIRETKCFIRPLLQFGDYAVLGDHKSHENLQEM